MTDTGPDTILLDLFRTNQVRERLIEASLDGLELPPEDYPFYVLIGAEGPWTPTLLAERMKMPLSTVLFRVGRLDQRGHIERVPNPDDKRSYLISLSPDGQKLLKQARPRFRAFAESVEERLGQERVDTLRGHLGEVRDRLDVRRVQEHVHRPRPLERVAPLLRQLLHVRGQGRRVARDVDDPRRLEAREAPQGLAGEPGPRRVDHRYVGRARALGQLLERS